MIVKGTKQLGSFKRGINLYTPKKIISQAAQVIWKVAIFGAGTDSSNGEYVWDGSQVNEDGTKIYSAQSGNQIYFYSVLGETYSNSWVIDDIGASTITYYSQDLISWYPIEGSGASPAPSSALSYAQDSFISSITISYPDLSLVDGTYSRATGGTTTLFDGSNYNYIFNYISGTWYLWSEDVQDSVGDSLDLVRWNAIAGFAGPINLTAVSYSA